MADLRRPIEIYLDVENSARKALQGTAAFSDPVALSLYRGTQVVFRCHLMMSDATTYYTPAVTDTWLFGIDNVYTRDHTDLVVSLNAQFNLDGDWDQRDVVGGKICWRVDLTSAALKTALADSENAAMYCALWVRPSGGDYTLLGHWDITMRNVAVDPTTALEQEGISFATVDLVNADIAELKTPTGGIYRVHNGALQLWNPDQSKWHTVGIKGGAGAEFISYGPGET